jgi:intracellular septation protein
MKFLFDLFPVILFFSVLKWGESHTDAATSLASNYLSSFAAGGVITPNLAPILLATVIAIIATACPVIYLLLRKKKIDGMLWLSLAIVTLFGGATVYFQNEAFIKWKPTILYWCIAFGLLVSQVFFKKNLIRMSMGHQISLPDQIWQRLSFVWVLFFSSMGMLNLYVAFNYSTDTWANFKLFGVLGLTFAFIIGQTVFLSKYIEEPK